MLRKHEAKARHSHEYDAIARVQISFINQLCGIGFLARHRNPLRGNVTSKENDTPTEIQSHDQNVIFPTRCGIRAAPGKPDGPQSTVLSGLQQPINRLCNYSTQEEKFKY